MNSKPHIWQYCNRMVVVYFKRMINLFINLYKRQLSINSKSKKLYCTHLCCDSRKSICNSCKIKENPVPQSKNKNFEEEEEACLDKLQL